MADIGFNLLMSRILRRLHEELDTLPAYCAGREALGVDVPPIAWVDDLAIPISTTTPFELDNLMIQVASAVHTVFTEHGMTLNLSSGKTEAVLSIVVLVPVNVALALLIVLTGHP